MADYYGEHDNVIDPKGRLYVPAAFRKALPDEANDTFVVTRGLDGCLSVYGLDDWNHVKDGLRSLSATKANDRQFVRLVLSQAAQTKVDRQGRIAIPRKLLDRAGIVDRATAIGVLGRFELWNPERYEQYMQDADEHFVETAENIGIENLL
ncbi:MAG: division/cell wall cluster transcriptional repressor MraZ [Candidatus Latescibacterota bacterium]